MTTSSDRLLTLLGDCGVAAFGCCCDDAGKVICENAVDGENNDEDDADEHTDALDAPLNARGRLGLLAQLPSPRCVEHESSAS